MIIFSLIYRRETNIFFLSINIFIYNLKRTSLTECNYTHPIKKDGECTIGGCTLEQYKSGYCSIANDLIKIQWLTSIIKYSDSGVEYSTLATTPQGTLICISSYYETSTNKFFYGLKKMEGHILLKMVLKHLFIQLILELIEMKEMFMVFN